MSKGEIDQNIFFKQKSVSTSRPFDLLHIDLFGPTRTTFVSGKRYALVVLDDYSRWTWVMFLVHKDESFKVFFKFYKRVQNEKIVCITSTRSDHDREFENEYFHLFCKENGILHNFSNHRTPQQNGVIERKNISLQEMARTMLNDLTLTS